MLSCVFLACAQGCAPANKGISTAALQKIAEGENALQEAQSGSFDNASVLDSAQRMLQKARVAFSVREFQIASWRAEEAIADITYARVRAAEEKAGRHADDLKGPNKKLKAALSEAGTQ